MASAAEKSQIAVQSPADIRSTHARLHVPRRLSLPQRLAGWAGVTGLLLLVPLAAIQVTQEVTWTAFDFAVAGGLIFGAALVFELATLRVEARAKLAVGAAVMAAVLLVWAEGAVGILH